MDTQDKVIGIILIIFGIRHLLVSIKFLPRIQNRLKKVEFLIEPMLFIIAGGILLCKDWELFELIDSKLLLGIIFPIGFTLLGISSLWLSHDENFIKVAIECEHETFFHILPKISEKVIKTNLIAAGISLILVGGLFYIYLFWVKKSI